MLMKGRVGAVMALAAGRGHGQLELQVLKAGAAFTGGAGDVAVGDSVADANYHVRSVMRIVRIIKRI